jgi:carbamoyl-phosphate synthase small subunit
VAKLVLEDGREFQGKALGAHKISWGEIVFNTGMTGYQETLTDPSYCGQIITFTYPEIGNYGCNSEDNEYILDDQCFTKGMVIKNYSPIVSNFRAEESLEEFLIRKNITAICDIDTRALTRHIRDKGAMKAIISPEDISTDELLQQLQQVPSMNGLDLAKEVSCKQAYKASLSYPKDFVDSALNTKSFRPKIIAIDFGIKQNIINKLIQHGCDLEVVPAKTSAKELIEKNPDGIFLSNGPGDPAAVSYAIETARELVKSFHKPIFGICLGHQILALAMGAKTYKLKFGHRGANQPIKNLSTSKIEIASHNHGFAVSKEGLPETLEITHLNINDDTIAGIKLKTRDDVFSVQYHPEASPGPHDSDYLFRDFVDLVSRYSSLAVN